MFCSTFRHSSHLLSLPVSPCFPTEVGVVPCYMWYAPTIAATDCYMDPALATSNRGHVMLMRATIMATAYFREAGSRIAPSDHLKSCLFQCFQSQEICLQQPESCSFQSQSLAIGSQAILPFNPILFAQTLHNPRFLPTPSASQ